MAPQVTSDKRLRLAYKAEAALAEFLAECGDMLWPDERRSLQKARHIVAEHADR